MVVFVVDVLEGLPADVRGAIEAAPMGDKSLLELKLVWGELPPEEKEAAERVRVFLITWDPFDWLDGRDLFFATTNGGDNWEIVLHLPLWNLETMATASEMRLGAALGQLGRAAVRVASRYRDEIVRGRYPELVYEGSAPGLLSAAIVDPVIAVPAVSMVSVGWEPMGLGAIQDLAQDAFGPVDLDRSLVELSASAEPEEDCPACAARRFGFPADLGEHRSAMCPWHDEEAGVVTTARLRRAELSNSDGWSAIGAACQAMERPHLPNGLRRRLRQAVEASDLGGGTDGDLRRDVQAVLELTAHFAGRPDDLAVAFDEEDWGLIDFFSCFPLNLAGRGLVDEAVAVGDALAEVVPELHAVLRNDVAVILAEAGREQQARERLVRNLAEFPTDTWTRIHAGDALAAIGDVGGAEARFREAVMLARQGGDPEDVVAAYERLGELFAHLPGRQADLGALEEEQRAWQRETGWIVATASPVRRGAPKVGRNDPVPAAAAGSTSAAAAPDAQPIGTQSGHASSRASGESSRLLLLGFGRHPLGHLPGGVGGAGTGEHRAVRGVAALEQPRQNAESDGLGRDGEAEPGPSADVVDDRLERFGGELRCCLVLVDVAPSGSASGASGQVVEREVLQRPDDLIGDGVGRDLLEIPGGEPFGIGAQFRPFGQQQAEHSCMLRKVQVVQHAGMRPGTSACHQCRSRTARWERGASSRVTPVSSRQRRRRKSWCQPGRSAARKTSKARPCRRDLAADSARATTGIQ